MDDVLALSVGTCFQVRKGELPNGKPAFGPVMTRESGRMASYSHEGRPYSVALSGEEEFILVKNQGQQSAAQPSLQLKFA